MKIYDEIANAKQPPRKQQLKNARREVASAYHQYLLRAPAFSQINVGTLQAVTKSALHHAFGSATKPMTELREALTQTSTETIQCPLCSIGEATTLDHYLPKEHFAHYSVYPLNLVPSCAACNTKKRAMVFLPGTQVRQFLHPYFDALPNQAFLAVDINITQNAIKLSYSVGSVPSLTACQLQQLRSHFDKLELADRYRSNALLTLRTLARHIDRWYGPQKDAQKVAAELLYEAENLADLFGINHWKAALLRSLAAHAAFCDGGFSVIGAIP